ncbi:MAG: flagellar motor switch protein FliN [Halanaerobiales bacterium]|nr:flagellar motor switch protein FliN [Halanaerobiales bacterium]
MSDHNNILSQEEIDALISNKSNGQQLTEEEKDVLGEVGNIAMGSAATALYTILDQKVEITAPEVSIATFGEISAQYERPCVLVKVKYTSGLEGMNLLIIKEEDAAIIADLMMGGDGSSKDIELDEIHLSAVGEAMNQMMGSSSTAISSIINDVVNISPPETDYLDLNEAISQDEYFSADEQIVDTSFRLKIGNLVDSSFKQLAPLEFSKRFAARLMEANGGGLTAKNGNPQDDRVQAEVEREVVRRMQDKPETDYVTTNLSAKQDLSIEQRRGSTIREEVVGVKRAKFPDFDESTPAPLPHNMELIQDVPLQVTVQLGKSRMTIKEILDLGEGSIIELDKLAGEPVDLLVNGKLIAKGEVVVIDENFGFRVKDIVSPLERINNV